MKTPDMTLVIPAHNEEKYLTATLDAVMRAVRRLEAAGKSCEVIVVDNDSTDATAQVAARPWVRVTHEAKRNIGAVRNRGAREASGRNIAFLDADSLPSENALVRIVETLDRGDCAGGGVMVRPDRWVWWALPIFALMPAVQLVLGVTAGMIYATKEAFDAVGGFDEGLYAAEDLEFVLALKKYGHKTGKKFANLSDVHIVTSVRKFGKAHWRDYLVFPRYLLNRNVVRDAANCRFWYGEDRR